MDAALSPSGRVYLAPSEGSTLEARSARAIGAAFERGEGEGVLHLGAAEAGELPPGLAFLRDLGRAFVTALCQRPDLDAARGRVEVAPPDGALDALVRGAPPMLGAEYLSTDALGRLFQAAGEAFGRAVEASKLTARGLIERDYPAFHLVGRVFFHLAENKRDPSAPFAFLATYAADRSAQGEAQHRPLGRALEQAEGRGQALLALLAPVQRAARSSPFVRELVESGAIYHPQAFSPAQAHAFLKSVPDLEASGVVVRVPNWWNPVRPPRPEVTVRVGAQAPSKLGKEALLDFSAAVTLGGEPLSEDEWRALAAREDGLVRVKGAWVELDRAKLEQALAQFERARRAVAREGLTFFEAMRVLAGVPGALGDLGPSAEAVSGWTRVEAGPWLEETLAALREPGESEGFGPKTGLVATLRPYQKAGAGWLHTLYRLRLGACLADDMGLGKTVQVIALLARLRQDEGRGPDLLVVPASLLGNWKSELARFAPGLGLAIAHGAAAVRAECERADVVMTTYGSLPRLSWLAEQAFRVVVIDEAQAIKNPGTRQARAVKALAARARVALTGTPVENRLGDLWSLFDFLNPGLLGTAAAFGRVTKELSRRGPGGYAPLRTLVRPYLLRRLKTDPKVIDDLPEKIERTVYCSLTARQAALYEQAVDELAAALDDAQGIARRGAILTALMRFKQICNHPAQWLGGGDFDPRQSGKFAALGALAEEIAGRQEKALIFTQFREMTAPLAAFLAGVFGRPGLVLSGATAVAKRTALVATFARDDGPPFFVLSLKAGGTGLNLTAASHVVHFDRWWNPAVEAQATDRAFRIGQRRNVLVHKLLCRGTVEEKIDALLTAKKGLADAVLEGDAGPVLTELSNEEILRLFSLDLGAALADEQG